MADDGVDGRAESNGRMLVEEFAGRFYAMELSMQPPPPPLWATTAAAASVEDKKDGGEGQQRQTQQQQPSSKPGKGASAHRAGQHVVAQFVKRRRMAPDRIVVTLLDSDTLLSERYILRLDALLTSWLRDPTKQLERRLEVTLFTPYVAFAPLDEQMRARTPLAVRAMDLLSSYTHLYRAVATGAPLRLPASCYSASLIALEAVGFWDVTDAGAGADTHLALRLYYSTFGAARIMPIYEACWRRSVRAGSSCEVLWRRFDRAAAEMAGSHLNLGYALWRGASMGEGEMHTALRWMGAVQMLEPIALLAGALLGMSALAAALFRSASASSFLDAHAHLSAPDAALTALSLALPLAIAALSEWLSSHHHHHDHPSPSCCGVVAKWLVAPIGALLLWVLPVLPAHWALVSRRWLAAPKHFFAPPLDDKTAAWAAAMAAAGDGANGSGATYDQQQRGFKLPTLTPAGPRPQAPPWAARPPAFLPSHRTAPHDSQPDGASLALV